MGNTTGERKGSADNGVMRSRKEGSGKSNQMKCAGRSYLGTNDPATLVKEHSKRQCMISMTVQWGML